MTSYHLSQLQYDLLRQAYGLSPNNTNLMAAKAEARFWKGIAFVFLLAFIASVVL